jgi:hypothetical protein
MRVNGAWMPADDGVIRPVVPGLVLLPDNQWHEVSFLLDAGADRTVFSTGFLLRLRELQPIDSSQILLSGWRQHQLDQGRDGDCVRPRRRTVGYGARDFRCIYRRRERGPVRFRSRRD